MRVAHILRKYDSAEWGGTETAIQQLTAGLAAQGVESAVYAPALAAEADADPLETPSCKVRRFRACLPIWGISSEHRRQMTALGGNLLSLDLAIALWRERRASIIHSHALGRLGAIGLAAARRRGIPFVVTIHGGVYDLPAQARKTLDAPAGVDWGKIFGMALRSRQLLARADAVVTCNPREAEFLRMHQPGRRTVVMTHSVRADLFAPDHREAARAAFPAIAGREILLVLGRIDRVKNQGWVVAQAAEIARRHPNALLAFAGACTDPDYERQLLARVAAESLAGHVAFLGRLPAGDPRLIGLLQDARALLLPSISETFGLVILEAWAAGTPVISSRTSGAASLIRPGVDGALFDLELPAGFHAALDAILLRPELREAWGGAGRDRVAAEYDTAAAGGRMKRLYELLIQGGKMRHVILRDDDTCAATPPECLERLYRPLLDLGLPVNLAVIPEVRARVQDPNGSLEGFLAAGTPLRGPTAPIAENPDLVSYLLGENGFHIVQHGCHHDAFEFDSGDAASLGARMDRGGRRFAEAGFNAPTTFVAPHDRLSREAFSESARRFAVISTGWFERGRLPLRWWPAFLRRRILGKAHFRTGGTSLLSHPGCLLSCHRPSAGVLESVQKAVELRPLTVLVTHWWEYFRGGTANEPFIQALHAVGSWLAGRPDVRVVSFAEVASRQIPLG